MTEGEVIDQKEVEAQPIPRMLLVDDIEHVLTINKRALNALGIDNSHIGTASNGPEALSLVEKGEKFSGAIIDNTMDGKLTGLEVIASLKERDPEILTALCSGDDLSDEQIEELREKGVDYFLPKPTNLEQVERFVQTVKEKLKNNSSAA